MPPVRAPHEIATGRRDGLTAGVGHERVAVVDRSASHQLGDAEDRDLALDSLRVGLVLDHAIGDGASAREVDLPGRVDGHEVELRVHSSTAGEVCRRRKPYCA